MNKIGFNLLPWSAGISEKVFPIMDRLKLIGYDGVEVLIGSENQKEYKHLSSHARDLGLEITTVFVLGEQDNIISKENKVRQSGIDRIKWAIDRANDLDAKVICGPFHSAHGSFSRASPTDQEYGWSSEALFQAGDYAKEGDIILTLEAVNRFETYLVNTMAQLLKLIELVDHPNVKAMYDTHHANIEEKEIYKPIKSISKHLTHVHISENDRGTPGYGLVHWDDVFKVLKQLDYKGWYTIESFSRADPDFANAINVWREFSDPWQIAEKGYSFIKKNLIN